MQMASAGTIGYLPKISIASACEILALSTRSTMKQYARRLSNEFMRLIQAYIEPISHLFPNSY